MVPPQWSRLFVPPAAAVLAVTLAGCSPFTSETEQSTPEAEVSSPAGGAAGAAARVSLVQKLGQDGPVRTLNVQPDGRWECDDCAGDGVTSTGSLNPEQLARLRGLLADPRLSGETDQARQYRLTCIGALTSSVVTAAGQITSQDCPGEEHPPVANEILLLLTQATPAEPTA